MYVPFTLCSLLSRQANTQCIYIYIYNGVLTICKILLIYIYLFINNILYTVSTPFRIFVDNIHYCFSNLYHFDVCTVKFVQFTYFTYHIQYIVNILYIYIYTHICCGFVGLDNKKLGVFWYSRSYQ